MPKVRFDITMTLDGYVAGPNQSEDNPLGEGGMGLHDWAFKLKSWNESHGRDGGETGPSDDVARESMANIGARIMGRNMFGPIRGPWDAENPWNGWWGDDPPFHTPVFVLTHHQREPLTLSDTTFTFVTDGIESALEQAKQAADDKDVNIPGGAQCAQQSLKAGLVDEMELHVVPMLLGDGVRLFENVGDQLKLEPIRVIETPDVTHLKYRVAK